MATVHARLASHLRRAEELYTGQQHVRLLRGIREARQLAPWLQVDLHIVSAGYGLVSGQVQLPPYEVTFSSMSKSGIKQWASELGIPGAFRDLVAKPYDLIVLLLGDKYLCACQLDSSIEFGGPTLAFSSSSASSILGTIPKVTAVPVTAADSRRDQFSCPLIALKGELGRRLLFGLARSHAFFSEVLSSRDVKALLLSP